MSDLSRPPHRPRERWERARNEALDGGVPGGGSERPPNTQRCLVAGSAAIRGRQETRLKPRNQVQTETEEPDPDGAEKEDYRHLQI